MGLWDLFTKKKPATPPPEVIWTVESWSTELGRGEVRASTGQVLPFDASVASVSRFDPGDPVRVRLTTSEPVKVASVVPKRPPRRAPMQPQIRLESTGSERVRVHAFYPYDWRSVGKLDPLFAAIAPRLPGYVPGSHVFFSSFTSEGTPPAPYVGWSVEMHGLQVFGEVSEEQWRAFDEALRAALAHVRMREM